jgi:hypothetical protein
MTFAEQYGKSQIHRGHALEATSTTSCAYFQRCDGALLEVVMIKVSGLALEQYLPLSSLLTYVQSPHHWLAALVVP